MFDSRSRTELSSALVYYKNDISCKSARATLTFYLFFSDSSEDAFPVYTCQISECESASGGAKTFFAHLISGPHCDNFFKELGFDGHPDQDTRSQHSAKDPELMLKIEDKDQYWQQRSRTDHPKLKVGKSLFRSHALLTF